MSDVFVFLIKFLKTFECLCAVFKWGKKSKMLAENASLNGKRKPRLHGSCFSISIRPFRTVQYIENTTLSHD